MIDTKQEMISGITIVMIEAIVILVVVTLAATVVVEMAAVVAESKAIDRLSFSHEIIYPCLNHTFNAPYTT
jgi:hypothetical protein